MSLEGVTLTHAQRDGAAPPGDPQAGLRTAYTASALGEPTSGTLGVLALIIFSAGVMPSLVSLVLERWLGDAQHVQEALHAAVEAAGACIAVAVALFLMLRSRHERQSAHLLWVVAALLMMGLMHAVHGILPFGLAWSWLRNAAALVGGLLFALVWLPVPPGISRHRRAFILAILSLTTLVTLGIGFVGERLPEALEAAGYTPPVKIMNLLGGAGYVVAAAFFVRRYRQGAHLEDLVFTCHTLLLAGAALLFGFSHPWAPDWWAWHAFRLLAYAILLLAGYRVIGRLYQDLAGKALELEERVQARTADLQKSEEKYRSLFDNMSEGFAIGEALCRPDGTPYDFCFLDINRAFERQSGLAKDDLLGKPMRQVLPYLEQQWIDTYCGVALSGQPVHFDAPNADTGKHYDVLCYSPAKGRFATIFTDITERKRSEEALRRYELLAGNSRDVILFIRVEDGRILEANAAAVQAYGYTREELLEKTIYELRAESTRGGVAGHIVQADTSGALFETQHVRKDGSLLPVEVSARGVSIGRERVIISVIRDIADRKQAEKAVEQANDRLARIAKVTASVVGAAPLAEQVTILAQQAREAFDADACVMRIMEGEDLVLLASTGVPAEKLPPRISGTLGVAGEVIGRKRGILIPDVRTSPICRDFAVPAANVYSFASYAGVPLMLGDQVIGIFGIYWQKAYPNCEEADLEHLQALANNITVSIVNDGLHKQLSGQRDQLEREIVERKQAVDALRESQEALQAAKDAAETANKAKDHFLSVLSHELRTPLTPVLMTASALECDDGVPTWIREDMGLVRRSVDLEVKLIDDLLDINRIMRGKLGLRLEELDAHLKIISAVELCRPDAEAKKVGLATNLDARLSEVSGDTGRLQQIVWNLVKNSIKFTPAGGRIHVRTLNPAEGLLRIEVQDTGIGMPPESIPRLFRAFEQADELVARQFGGLGLGLAICKALVEMHGGTITGASEGAGRGATFTVDLPTISPKQAALSPDIPRRPGHEANCTSVRILYVEDHATTSQVMQKMFASAGHEVIAATTARDAIAAAKKHAFDLLVCDLGLPDGSGLDIMRELRERNPQVKGIALSGFGMDTDIERSLAAGFREHLTKPVEMPALLAAIARVAAAG